MDTSTAQSSVPRTDVCKLSVVMPCLNEAATVGRCVQKALSAIDQLGIHAEVVVSDNGSTDQSVAVATLAGARVVQCPTKGYGSAIAYGVLQAKGAWVLVGDSDESYDFGHLPRFVEQLSAGSELVMGNRFQGGVLPGAMPWKNRYIGNPVLTAILNFLFHTRIGDAHCGLRAFTVESFKRMDLRCPGMEFASEMVVKAAKLGLRISEVPTTLSPDGRGGRAPHLRPWRDGWRHLRFLLMSSPLHLFLIPALLLLILGVIVGAFSMLNVHIGNWRFGAHWLAFGSLLFLLSMQIGQFGVLARQYSIQHWFSENDPTLRGFQRWFTLETGLWLSASFLALGVAIDGIVAWEWVQNDYGELHRVTEVLCATTLIGIGLQTAFFSFLFAIMGSAQSSPN